VSAAPGDPVAVSEPAAPAPPTASARAEWWAATRIAGAIWLIFTLLRYLVAAVTEYMFQPDHGRLAQGLVGLLKLPFTFDSGYYAAIARYGYFGEIGSPIWQAFFPGYPVVMRAVSAGTTFQVTDGRLMVAGSFISAVCSLVATVVVYRLAAATGERRAGTCAALLLMLWPTATFLTAAYSESLYLALAVGAWWNALKGRWWVAGLLCAYASFTRINGVFLAVALLVLLLVRVARKEERFRFHKLLAVAFGIAGAAGYLIYLWMITGNPRAWQDAQLEGWGRQTVWPWTSLKNTLDGLVGIDDPLRQAQWAIDIFAVAFCLLAAGYMIYRRYWPELTLTLITVGILASSFNYMSIMRNTLTIFPLFVIGGGILARRPEWFTAMVLTLSGVWMIATTVLFTLTEWAG
jgi:preprotein translocase subunit Sss1